MIDPGTIALAASAFAAVKKGIAFGKDIEGMYKDVSRWMSACHDIETKHNKVKRKKGQSVAEEAMETWAAVRKIRQQREELRLYMLSINPNAWNDFVRLEGQIRKKRADEAEARRRQIKKTVEIIMVVLLMVCISLAFGALVWWALHLRDL
jgi:hypothetical protein